VAVERNPSGNGNGKGNGIGYENPKSSRRPRHLPQKGNNSHSVQQFAYSNICVWDGWLEY